MAEEPSDTESEASSIDMLPVESPKPKVKKPKVFVTDTAAMLALIDQAADKEDAKLGKRLERQNELKKRYKAQDDEARLKKQKRANQVNEAKSRVIQEVKQRRKQRKQEDQAAEEKKARKSAKKTLRFA
ncbi:hypothetical protein IWQ60_009249 [Tieghemiomyces parasiticus]|uniref:Uncharacterized protein n=1 Tax=Tieghemiomyces parasiticus TaxID=78921 RepID=A0A9W7ZNQ7_9FUNG|nr:hypothetical protein IWQ60_009249 [Tieghemiomyces parasiticus]